MRKAYAEWWVSQPGGGNATMGTACNKIVQITNLTTYVTDPTLVQVCSNQLTASTVTMTNGPWTEAVGGNQVGFAYAPSGLSTTGSDAYVQIPMFYIAFLSGTYDKTSGTQINNYRHRGDRLRQQHRQHRVRGRRQHLRRPRSRTRRNLRPTSSTTSRDLRYDRKTCRGSWVDAVCGAVAAARRTNWENCDGSAIERTLARAGAVGRGLPVVSGTGASPGDLPGELHRRHLE